MSEYQYYEFQAIDRPLDEEARAELRAISSRAEITATRFANEYSYGSFRGNADHLMDRYFDAHLYLANWGTRRFMLRMPVPSFPLTPAEPYLADSALLARATREHVILDFHSNPEDGYDGWQKGEGWLDSLVPLRSDLLAGDLRCLYLAWLFAVEYGHIADDETEPPVPPGLGQLSAPLERFIDFIRVDPDLVEAAAAASAEGVPSSPSAEELTAWVAQLPRKETDRLLVRLMRNEGPPLAGQLLQRFREDQARRRGSKVSDESAAPPRRKAGELLEARDRLAAEKEHQAAQRAEKEQARKAREQAKARARHLDALVGREEELWQQVEKAIEVRQAKEYGQAVAWLIDLRDLAQRAGIEDEFTRRMRVLRANHGNKRTLLKRLDLAELPK